MLCCVPSLTSTGSVRGAGDIAEWSRARCLLVGVAFGRLPFCRTVRSVGRGTVTCQIQVCRPGGFSHAPGWAIQYIVIVRCEPIQYIDIVRRSNTIYWYCQTNQYIIHEIQLTSTIVYLKLPIVHPVFILSSIGARRFRYICVAHVAQYWGCQRVYYSTKLYSQ